MFHGSIVALLTPMNDHGDVDFAALCELLEWHVDQGSNGLVIAGTTGESATLSGEEFRAVLARAVSVIDGRIPVLAGTGTADTAKTIERSQQAADLGADGLLVVTPYYVRPPQRGLEAHFTAVAEASAVPVVLYNVPSRTSVDLAPETAARLSGHPNIVGIKEAVGDRARVERLKALCVPGFTLLSGDDPSALDAMEVGAAGVISVAANVVPGPMRALCDAVAGGDVAAAGALNERLERLFTQLGAETNPIPVKWAAWRMGLMGPGIRLPLLPLDNELQPALDACLAELGLLPGEKTIK